MLNLYFNTKITGKSPNRNAGEYFYPVTYPDADAAADPIDVLIYTIKSYSALEFDHVFFNLDLGGPNLELQKDIEAVIRESIIAKNFHISYTRPSTLQDWNASVAKVGEMIGGDSLLLVAMNHDHPFVDYTAKPLLDLIGQVFGKDSYKKVLYYSHTPELLSWAMNGKDRGRYTDIGNFVYQSPKIDNWLDSFCVMTPRTLLHILGCAIPNVDYMGRIDWPGVKYSNLDLTALVSPREYFKHYDGYGHVTGLRLMSSTKSLKDINPADMNLQKQCNFYFQKWIDVSILSIKDRLAKASKGQLKETYINHVDHLFNIFTTCYLQQDKKLGIITADHYEAIVRNVYERIYLESNSLILQINLDNMLHSRLEAWSPASIIPLRLKRFLKNILGM